MDADRDELVRAHLWLVDRVHRSVLQQVPHGVGSEDLRACGHLGLVQAAERFNPDAGVPFPAFAEIRVRGAMIDCARSWDGIPTGVLALRRRVAATADRLRAETGSEPSDATVAAALGIDAPAVASVRTWLRSRHRLPLDEVSDVRPEVLAASVDPSVEDALERVELQDLVAQVRSILRELPPAQRTVLELIYLRGVKGNVIAEVLGVTPSRVSQLKHEALEQLRCELLPPPRGIELRSHCRDR